MLILERANLASTDWTCAVLSMPRAKAAVSDGKATVGVNLRLSVVPGTPFVYSPLADNVPTDSREDTDLNLVGANDTFACFLIKSLFLNLAEMVEVTQTRLALRHLRRCRVNLAGDLGQLRIDLTRSDGQVDEGIAQRLKLLEVLGALIEESCEAVQLTS